MEDNIQLEIRDRHRSSTLPSKIIEINQQSATNTEILMDNSISFIKKRIFGSKEATVEFKDALCNYYIFLSTYLLGFCLLFAIVLSKVDNLKYIDAFFICVSAITSTGLSTVSMKDLSTVSFIIIALLMFLGNICVIQIINLTFRLICANNYIKTVKASSYGKIPEVLDKIENLADNIRVVWWAFIVYLISSHAIGFLLYFGDLHIFEHEPELVERGIPVAGNAMFITISSLANSGFAISSSSLFYLKNNFFAYFVVAWMVLIGNTLLPVLIRQLIRFFKRINFCSVKELVYDYVLDNPRKISWYIFGSIKSKILLQSVVFLNIFFYIFYLGCAYSNDIMKRAYGDNATLAGIGAFQVISLRSAGLQIMDFRLLNRGLMVVWVVAMYIPTAPYIGKGLVGKDEMDAKTMYEKKGMIGGSLSSGSGSGSGSIDLEDDDILHEEFMHSSSFIKKNILNHTFFIFLSVAICSCIESDYIRANPEVNNVFFIFFEIISAYGNVGVSMGVPNEAYNLCGKFQTTSKLIVIFMMLLGKFRGIPKLYDEVIDYHFTRARQLVYRALLIKNRQEKFTLEGFSLTSASVSDTNIPFGIEKMPQNFMYTSSASIF